MRQRWLVAAAVGIFAASGLAGCGSSGFGTSSSGANAPNNLLACTNFDVVFLHEAVSQAVNQQDGQAAITFGEKAESSAVRSAAQALTAAANAQDQSAYVAAMTSFAEACHQMGIGPGGNQGG